MTVDIKQRRNLETEIAQALGWTGVDYRFEQIGGSRVGKSPDNPRILQPIPTYLVDYNAWSRVESYMAEKFTAEQMSIYVGTIEQIINDQRHRRAETVFRMINAPLPIRARAFLAAANITQPTPAPEAA